MALDRSGDQKCSARRRLPQRLSRRSVLIGATVAIAALPSCSVLTPGGVGIPNPTRSPASTSPTPPSGSLVGVNPLPAIPSPSPTPEPILVRFAHWETGDARAVLDDVVASFIQRTPNIIVRQEVQPFGTHFDRIQAGFVAGDAPDAFVSSGAHFYGHLADSRLLDLLPRMTADGIHIDDYWTDPTTRAINGHVFGVPLWTGVDLVFVNRDQIDQAGLAPPLDDWTWDGLLALAGQLTVGKPGEVSRWGMLIVNDLIGGWGSFVTSNGGSWIDLEARKTAFDPAAIDALNWIANTMTVHHVAPRPLDQQAITRGGTIDPFLAGKVSILINGSWELPTALKNSSFRWDIVRLPRAPRTDASVSLSSIQPGCAARETRHPDETWRLLGSLLTMENQRRWNPGKIRVPALKTLAANVADGFGAPPPQNAGIVAVTASRATDPRFTLNWQPFRSALIQALEVAFNGQTDLDSAIQNAVKAGDIALAG